MHPELIASLIKGSNRNGSVRDSGREGLLWSVMNDSAGLVSVHLMWEKENINAAGKNRKENTHDSGYIRLHNKFFKDLSGRDM